MNETQEKLQQLNILGNFATMMKETFQTMNSLCKQELKKNSLRENGGTDNNKIKHEDEEPIQKQQHQNDSDNMKIQRKKKKQAKWQLEGKPRPPLNAFMLFLRDSKFQIQQARPQLTSSAVSTYASTIWNDLPEEQKQKYRSQYRENRRKYQEQLEQYKLSFPESHKIKGQKKKKKKKKSKNKNKQEEVQHEKALIQISDSQNQQYDSLQI